MTNNHRHASIRFSGGLLFAAMLIGAPNGADACSCMMSPTNCQNLATAAAVFEATVESIERRPADQTSGQQNRVRLKDLKAYRGEMQSTVVTSWSTASCGYPFDVGVRYLIVAGRSPGGELAVSLCGLTKPVAGARGLIDYAQALNEEPVQTRVWGRVFRTKGPVAGAVVTFHGPKETVVTTDDNGQFLVRGLPEGSYSASAKVPPNDTAARPYFGEFELKPGVPHACAELMFVVPPTGQITGVVLDERGDPMARAFITLKMIDSSGNAQSAKPTFGTEADTVGRYYFFEIPPGSYQVAYGDFESGQVLARASSGSTDFSVRDDEVVTLEPLRWIPPAKLATQGRLRDPDGQPVAMVEIQPQIMMDGGRFLAGPPVVSDANGVFTVNLMEGHRYRLVVGSNVAPRGELEVVADGQPFTIVIRR